MLINIGFGNIVNSGKIIAVVSPNSSPVRRTVNETKENGMLVDATQGRKTKAVIFTESGHLILSAVATETIARRMGEIL